MSSAILKTNSLSSSANFPDPQRKTFGTALPLIGMDKFKLHLFIEKKMLPMPLLGQNEQKTQGKTPHNSGWKKSP